MKENRKNEYQDIFIKMSSEVKKKKGGSLGAVFKLIQELTEFEEKIQECASAQEMTENQKKIESFLTSMDTMYSSLFDMAKGGVQSIRSDRQQGQIMDGVTDNNDEVVETEDIDTMESENKQRPPLMLNVPQVPKM